MQFNSYILILAFMSMMLLAYFLLGKINDDYSRWQSAHVFGIHTVCPYGITEITKGEPVHLSDTEKEAIKGNITQNVTSLAKENPNITFYYFFTPYSAVWWSKMIF